MHNREKFDVVVIGGGPSGSVSAAYLHKHNFSVVVIEKQTFPRFVIGESLLPHCMDQLEEADLLEAVRAKEFQVKTGAAFYRGEQRCDFLFKEQFTKGWEWTWQVKRAEFDKTLTDEIQKKGVDVRFNCEVTEVTTDEGNRVVTYLDEQGAIHEIEAKFIIDASGYGRVLPRLFDLNEPSDLPARGSIFAHVKDVNRTEEAGNNIFIHSFNNNEAWVWAIPFSDGITSVGVVGNDTLIREFAENGGAKYKEFIRTFADLKGRFSNADLVFEPKHILGYSIGIKQMYGDGYVLCGNSTEFLDPVFSSGVTLATASGMLAAKLVERTLNGETIDWHEEYQKVMLKGVEVFRSYVKGWYDGSLQTIFFADKIEPEFKKQICSVLAGYVWDETNPFIQKHKTILPTLSKVIELRKAAQANA